MARLAALPLAALLRPAAGLLAAGPSAPLEPATGALGISLANGWDLAGALADQPPGAFKGLLGPVGSVVRLSYTSTHGFERVEADVGATIPAKFSGGATWERLPSAEADPPSGGLHAVVLRNAAAKRLLVAFRGVTLSPVLGDRGRNMDLCAFAALSNSEVLPVGVDCGQFTAAELDYLGQATEVLGRARALHPDHAVLLTGHSLGAKLAVLAAAKQGSGVKALTFGLGSVHEPLKLQLNFSSEQIAALPAENFVALENPCDPYYIKASTEQLALKGTTVCVYSTVQPVSGCKQCITKMGNPTDPSCMESFIGAHSFKSYLNLLKPTGPGAGPAVPSCTAA